MRKERIKRIFDSSETVHKMYIKYVACILYIRKFSLRTAFLYYPGKFICCDNYNIFHARLVSCVEHKKKSEKNKRRTLYYKFYLKIKKRCENELKMK